ncbi:MAG: hypothetical protein JW749_00155 [Sedimentisphaerales bacterium]|nr:hypothetical protein [Sedimentisphaerales bacterium]
MWLPENERRLLQAYYDKIGEHDKEEHFFLKDLLQFIKSNLSFDKPPSSGEDMKAYSNELSKIVVANKVLEARKLIILREGQHNNYSSSSSIPVKLTLTGYDLGRKYNSWLSRSGLWFAEYKDHWFWLIVSFLGGIIGALIVNWLSK